MSKDKIGAHRAKHSMVLPANLTCLVLFTLVVLIFLTFINFACAEDKVKVIVTGVEGEAQINVQETLALPYGLIQDGKVDRQWLTRFIRQAEEKVPASLEPFGYYSARASVVLEIPNPDEFIVHVDVHPGPAAILTDVNISVTGPGKTEESLMALVRSFPLKKGDIPVHIIYDQARHNLETRARDLGYLDVAYTTHEIRIDEAGTSARISLVLETGEKYFFSTITLQGAPDYPDAYLRRFISISEGDVFSQARLDETQLQLNNSERFREVTVMSAKESAIDHKIPVSILLTPLPRQSLNPGVGYGTDTGARFSTRYRNINLFHKGHELNSNLYIAEHLQGLATTYIIPGSKDIRTFTSVQLNFQREDITTYITSFAALELAQTNSFGASRQGTVYVRFQQEDFTIGSQSSIARYVLPGIRFSNTFYDNLVRPGRGGSYTFNLRGTHNILGSTTQLLQLITEGNYVFSLPWRMTVLTGARVGITFFSDVIQDLPPSLRFFAGGDQSVRGYAYQSLGPQDSSGQVVGGKHLLTGHIDLQRAILNDWAVSVFYNAGNAFDSFRDVTLFQAAGMGVHYYTPVGALNLFVARQIFKDDPEFRIHFTVGFEF